MNVLFLQGGWEGHHPDQICALFARELSQHGANTRIESSLDLLSDTAALEKFDLIFPCWTMGSLSKEQTRGLIEAVRGGCGLGGIHGGMGDAFRGNTEYEWMVGGHFVGHPHVGDYTVRLTPTLHEITSSMPIEFSYRSEQYYMLTDPGITVLAESTYIYEGKRSTMPVIWIKQWGAGRVFYSALGHDPREFTDYPHVFQMTVRGLLWTARRS